jgi:hypothetical protein
MMIPASSSPRRDRPPTAKVALWASSLASPVSEVAATKAMARAAVRPRASAVPTTAAVVLGPVPWERYSETSMMAMAPVTATRTGLCPRRMAGTTKATMTTNDRPSPSSDRIPCQRPKATTARTNRAARASMGRPRSRS